jgi:hypothetical protein
MDGTAGVQGGTGGGAGGSTGSWWVGLSSNITGTSVTRAEGGLTQGITGNAINGNSPFPNTGTGGNGGKNGGSGGAGGSGVIIIVTG